MSGSAGSFDPDQPPQATTGLLAPAELLRRLLLAPAGKAQGQLTPVQMVDSRPNEQREPERDGVLALLGHQPPHGPAFIAVRGDHLALVPVELAPAPEGDPGLG